MKSVYPGLDKVADMVSKGSVSKGSLMNTKTPKKKRLLTVPTRAKS